MNRSVAPLPPTLHVVFLRFQERVGGARHYRNSINWQSDGEIAGLAASAGLRIVKEIPWRGMAGKIVIAER